MRSRKFSVAATAAAAVLVAAVTGTAVTSSANARPVSGTATTYVVLADQGTSVTALAQRLKDSGATVQSVNRAIGMVVVSSRSTGFRATANGLSGVDGVAADRSIGHAPNKPQKVEKENATGARKAPGRAAGKKPKPPTPVAADPLDSQLWGMRMINADQAHKINKGSPKVRVGVMDTGVQASNPDIFPNFDWTRSRNFVTDVPDLDGPCEVPSCVDPVGVDDGGHGTHVAGIIGAALNGVGVSGVAPKTDIVEVRAGQDSGYFFLAPTVNALTYSGDAGLDVVNMSFYVDPWLYNCAGGAPEDSPEEAAEQDTIIEAMNRALDYAHEKNVTLVAALGNDHDDISGPRHDFSSPDFGAEPHERTIDNASCVDLPTEGPNVIGVSSLGPSGKKSDFSNYATDLNSHEIEVSAPGGWFRDGFGTDTYRVNENLILSTYPLHVLQEEGSVDENGNVTPDGAALGVQKSCQADPIPGTDACGYYAFLQGTSMASPHAAGVAALAVAAHGHNLSPGNFGLAPSSVLALLTGTAIDHACPAGGVQEYLNEGRSAEFTATCAGTPAFNGFYGAGIVNALGVVQ